MFESNFPVDMGSCDLRRPCGTPSSASPQGYSADEKTALFSGTATKVYRLEY